MLGLATICRHIRGEALPIFFFADNSWCIVVKGLATVVDTSAAESFHRQWLETLSNGSARHFCKVALWIKGMASEQQWKLVLNGCSEDGTAAADHHEQFMKSSKCCDKAWTKVRFTVGPIDLKVYHRTGCLTFEGCSRGFSMESLAQLRKQVEEHIARAHAAIKEVETQATIQGDDDSLRLIVRDEADARHWHVPLMRLVECFEREQAEARRAGRE